MAWGQTGPEASGLECLHRTVEVPAVSTKAQGQDRHLGRGHRAFLTFLPTKPHKAAQGPGRGALGMNVSQTLLCPSAELQMDFPPSAAHRQKDSAREPFVNLIFMTNLNVYSEIMSILALVIRWLFFYEIMVIVGDACFGCLNGLI